MSKQLEMPPRYSAEKLKQFVHGIKIELGFYQETPPKEGANPNCEAVRRFEEMYGVRITSINTNHRELRLGVHGNGTNGINGTSFTGVLALEDYFRSTTVQRLGVHICNVVIERSAQPKYQNMINQETIIAARKTKADLERRLGP
jgi:hypothetical protein